MRLAAAHRIELVLPSAVLAQVWRDGARQVITSDPGDLAKLRADIESIVV